MYSLRTDPERLLRQAEKMTADLGEMEESIRLFAQMIRSSEGYWSGEGAEAARSSGQRCAAAAEAHCSSLRIQLQNMMLAAEQYRTAELDAEREAEKLPYGGQ